MSAEILDRQIASQVEGKYALNFQFPDLKTGDTERISLYEQEGLFYVRPVFCLAKLISKAQFDAITAFAPDFSDTSNVREFDAVSELSYDNWMNKYYHNI